MSTDSSVLAGVGPRLRALRQRRDLTLTALSVTTGISVSTLSRLESGVASRPWSCCCRSPGRTGCRWTSWWGRRRWGTRGCGRRRCRCTA
ncbi:helix-turn-helix domain-containing protein [Klenkia terrae]|uniref:helix-turn-helix domain-containing protein n=1 Tax=Klenkia terrae TaxID=1052259 RepID=UPI00361EEAA0